MIETIFYVLKTYYSLLLLSKAHMLRTRSLLAADRNRLEKEWAPKSSWNMSLEWPVSVVSLVRVSRSQTVMVLLVRSALPVCCCGSARF